MRRFTKLPLYLGLSVLVFSVLLSATKIGEQKTLTYNRTRASSKTAVLSLKSVSPSLVSVFLNSKEEIAGVDVAIKYQKEKVTILPLSLLSGPSFITTEGILDEKTSVFSFSALKKGITVPSAIVATFSIQPKNVRGDEWVNLEFDTANGSTAVIEETSNKNILVRAEGVKFNLTSQ